MTDAVDSDNSSLEERLARLGKRIREARTEQALSLDDLGQKADVSPSVLSQIERGLGNPSYSTIVKLAHALQMPFASFFEGGDNADTIVVRRDKRRKLMLPGRDIVLESISPNANRKAEVLWWRLAPGFQSSEVVGMVKGEETIFVISGQLEMRVGDKTYLLDEGDSLYIGPNTPYSFGNSSSEATVCISVVVPPPF